MQQKINGVPSSLDHTKGGVQQSRDTLVCKQCRSADPSIAYAARVQGVPTNPMTAAAPPTSDRSARRMGAMNGSEAAGSSIGRSARTRSMLQMCMTVRLES